MKENSNMEKHHVETDGGQQLGEGAESRVQGRKKDVASAAMEGGVQIVYDRNFNPMLVASWKWMTTHTWTQWSPVWRWRGRRSEC